MMNTYNTLRVLALLSVLSAAFYATKVRATPVPVEFIPPNDLSGTVSSTNANDGYFLGRGVVFEMKSDQVIQSVGIFHDLTDVNLSYEIAETAATDGNVTAGQTILSSGSQIVTTNGLEWIDFAIAPLTLEMGKSYHIEFSHAGNGNQNFFYNNQNVRFSEGSFAMLDGTQFGSTGNFTLSAIRVLIPEPSAASLALLGLFCVGHRFCYRV